MPPWQLFLSVEHNWFPQQMYQIKKSKFPVFKILVEKVKIPTCFHGSFVYRSNITGFHHKCSKSEIKKSGIKKIFPFIQKNIEKFRIPVFPHSFVYLSKTTYFLHKYTKSNHQNIRQLKRISQYSKHLFRNSKSPRASTAVLFIGRILLVCSVCNS